MSKKRTFPGTIYSPSANNRLYIKYKGKRIATGLRDTPEGRRLAAQMLETLYKESHGLIERTEIMSIKQAHREFVHKHCSNKTAKTTAGYTDAFKKITADKDYSLDLQKIENDVVSFMDTPKLSPASKNIHLRAFQVFMNFCSDRSWIKKYDFYKKYKKTVQAKPVQVYTEEEVQKLVDHFAPIDAEFSLLLRFLYGTGYRIHEALGLEWKDVQTEHIEKQSKHGHDTQYFPLTTEVRKILDELPKNRKKVFRWLPTSQSPLLKKLNEGMVVCKIPKLGRGFHTFRKTFRMRLLESGVQLEDVRNLMGHEDINVTLNHYTLIDLKRVKNIMEGVKNLK